MLCALEELKFEWNSVLIRRNNTKWIFSLNVSSSLTHKCSWMWQSLKYIPSHINEEKYFLSTILIGPSVHRTSWANSLSFREYTYKARPEQARLFAFKLIVVVLRCLRDSQVACALRRGFLRYFSAAVTSLLHSHRYPLDLRGEWRVREVSANENNNIFVWS